MRLHSKTPRECRSAFTLIELLIVISLIVVIAGIGFLTVPLFTSQQRASQGASIIVSWLGDAKVQALKQQQATGVRFVVDPTNPSFVREMFYVQTPDDFAGGMGDPTGGWLYQNGPVGGPGIASATLTFANVDFYGGLQPTDYTDWPVQPGDFLEINGGGLLYQVTAVPTSNTLTVSRAAYVGALSMDTTTPPATLANLKLTGYYTTILRIIRQPRRLTGEDSLTLNGNAAIDTTLWKNVPQRTVSSNPPQTYFEILFAPNGGVVGRGTNNSNAIVLWVRDSTQTDPLANEPVLISIQVRTGFIGTYQVDTTPGGDPYSFTRDPRASGM